MSSPLATYLKERRWFRAKARGLVSATKEEAFPLRLVVDGREELVTFAIVRCVYEDGGADDKYVLPIATATGDVADRIEKDHPHLVIAKKDEGSGSGSGSGSMITYDALGSERLLAAMLEQFFKAGGVRIEDESGRGGSLVFRAFSKDVTSTTSTTNIAPKPTKTEQTNTSIVFGNAFILKIVRKLDEGRSAELDMGEALTRHGYASSPEVVGAIEIVPDQEAQAEPWTVGILHRFTVNEGDAWTSTLNHLSRTPAPSSYQSRAELLGRRVGEMHVVLAKATEPSFAIKRLTREERAKLGDAVNVQARSLAKQWLREGDVEKIASRVDAFVALADDPPMMRIHGDLHLGQILATPGEDFVLIDFEGEPARPLAERKSKRSPLADVAGMLRSFDYAAATALRQKDAEAARRWQQSIADVFVAAYRSATSSESALRMTDEVWRTSLAFYLLEKCLYEIVYEANNRPDWIAIPRDGLQYLLDGPTPG